MVDVRQASSTWLDLLLVVCGLSSLCKASECQEPCNEGTHLKRVKGVARHSFIAE